MHKMFGRHKLSKGKRIDVSSLSRVKIRFVEVVVKVWHSVRAPVAVEYALDSSGAAEY